MDSGLHGRYRVVDVFAPHALAGNPAAVVLVDALPEAARMQAIATEFNLSETVFLLTAPDAEGRWPIRIFTPAEELPFAGHPVLGAAWVVVRELCAAAPDTLTLATLQGPVTVGVQATDGMNGARLLLRAPAVQLLPFEPSALQALPELLGMAAPALVAEPLPPQIGDVGPRFLLLSLSDRQALAQLRPQAAALCELFAAHHLTGVLLLAPAGAADPVGADFATRVLFNADGLREDPATGSASACVAAALQAGPGLQEVVLAQGVDMGRPSTLRLLAADAQGRVGVGGAVWPAFSGQLEPALLA